jgi:hypothetical protein
MMIVGRLAHCDDAQTDSPLVGRRSIDCVNPAAAACGEAPSQAQKQ